MARFLSLEYKGTHTMSILRNDADMLEAYCPECGKHILVRNTPSQLEILHQGDFHVKHLYPICSKEMGFNTMELE